HLDVLPLRADTPLEWRVLHSIVDRLLIVSPDAGLVDESTEVGRGRNVRRDRDESLADAVDSSEIEKDVPECCLSRGRGRSVWRQGWRYVDASGWRSQTAVE